MEKVAAEVVGGLKGSPLALALVVINVMYLAAGGWFLSTVADRAEKRDDILVKLASRECQPAARRE